MENNDIAIRLLEHARSLERRPNKNLYRVRALRRAASTIRFLERPLREILEEKGRAGLRELPDIGEHLALTLEGLLVDGELRTLDIDLTRIKPEEAITSLPGIGANLAHRLQRELGIQTATEVGQAAREGRLELLGLSSTRIQNILEALSVAG